MTDTKHPDKLKREEGHHWYALLAGEIIANPASTNRPLVGPALIEYRVWPDRGIDLTLHDLPPRGAAVMYDGPDIPARAGGMAGGIKQGTWAEIVTWYGGEGADGEPLAEIRLGVGGTWRHVLIGRHNLAPLE